MLHDHESKYSGVVKGIHEDYEDEKLVRLEIKPGNRPKPKTKKGEPAAYVETRSETISMEMGRGLKIGDRVEVVTTVHKVRKRAQPQVR